MCDFYKIGNKIICRLGEFLFVISILVLVGSLLLWPPLHKGTKCDMRFKSSLNSAKLNLLNPYK